MDASRLAFFRFTVFFQKVCGFRVVEQDGNLQVENYFPLLFLFVIYPIAIFFPLEIVMTVYNARNLSNFIKVFTNTVTHFGVIFKIMTYYVNRAQIFYCVNALKNQKYDCNDTDTIFIKYMTLADKWSKAYLTVGSFICFFMASSAFYFVVFEYKPLGEADIILFPDFGNTRLGFTLFWLYQMFPLSAYLWCSVGELMLHFFFPIQFIHTTYYLFLAMDSLYISSLSCMCAHFEMLQLAFTSINRRCKTQRFARLEGQNNIELQRKMENELTNCVQKLQTVLK